MTAMTMTAAPATAAPGLERITFWLLLAFVASLQVSIAAAGILLAATLIGWIAVLVRAKAAFRAGYPSDPPIDTAKEAR